MASNGDIAAPTGPRKERARGAAVVAAWAVAAALPLVGLASLLLRAQLDPHFENYRAHFVVFAIVGGFVFVLGYTAGEAANRRGDARVFLLSLAFMTTGGYLALHASGTPGILFSREHGGFQVAIPVGLLVSSVFAAGSAFVDLRPELGFRLMRYRSALRAGVLVSMGAWFAWTAADLPPLASADSEAARGSFLAVLAFVGTAVYAASSVRYWLLFRASRKLLPAAVTACFLLLSEAMVGVAVTGERKWHASWWEWHGLIVTAFLIIGFAARREWREERFRELYLATTRERRQEISVLFADLAGFTTFADRSSPADAAEVLNAYWSIAAPLITRTHGGEVEKFIGDGMMAVFNGRGDQPDHALRAARAALDLQVRFGAVTGAHPDWPRMRVGVNSGEVVLREIGGYGHVAYPIVGDTVNTGARLESLAPAGGVLIGPETYERLPHGATVEERAGLQVRGKRQLVDAYVLLALPA
jgi:class 3 adenylate cyclase